MWTDSLLVCPVTTSALCPRPTSTGVHLTFTFITTGRHCMFTSPAC